VTAWKGHNIIMLIHPLPPLVSAAAVVLNHNWIATGAAACLSFSTLVSLQQHTVSSSSTSSWTFDGQRTVQLELPIRVVGTNGRSYGEPVTLLGAGASGAVFRLEALSSSSSRSATASSSSTAALLQSFSDTETRPLTAAAAAAPPDPKNHHRPIALKVSWNDVTGQVIRNECATLRALAGVPHVPRCIELLQYVSSSSDNTDSSSSGRTMMVLEPVIDNVATSWDDLYDPTTAVLQIVETTIAMLRHGIYTVDVQWLLSKRDGNVLFIDFTERTDRPETFVTEVVAGIPIRWHPLALSTLQTIVETKTTHNAAAAAVDNHLLPPTTDVAMFDEAIEIFSTLLEGE
jgi:hypothetical protein